MCGDGVIEPPEECEDGNTVSGDGCSSDCRSSCEKCEREVCPLLDVDTEQGYSAFVGVYQATGTIATGPATGAARAEVARALADCIHTQNCSQTKSFLFKTYRCWCDHDFNTTTGTNAFGLCQLPADPTDTDPFHPKDPNHFIPGKCAQEYQDASEADTLAAVAASVASVSKAEGAVNRLLENCDARNCTEECLPAYFKHGTASTTAATITADILALRNQAGESALGDLVADSQRAIAEAEFAFAAFSFIAEAEPQTDLLFAATPSRGADADGRVLWSEARAVHVGHASGNTSGIPDPQSRIIETSLYTVILTGQQIYDALNQQLDPAAGLHVSGLSYVWDAAQPQGSQVVEVRKDGALLDKAASYTVALGETLVADTGPIPAFRSTNAVKVPNVDPVELLGEYLSTLPQPVAPPPLNRITRRN